jgi:predicted enzyme related to lactoylglutathione lyase
MAIAELRAIVLDCPDAWRLAEFYRDLLGWEIDKDSSDDGWVTLRNGSGKISFQRAVDHRAPIWPDPEHPQQFHLDVTVDDLDRAESEVLAIGATKAEVQPSQQGDFRVFLDPAGHPFCLCVD